MNNLDWEVTTIVAILSIIGIFFASKKFYKDRKIYKNLEFVGNILDDIKKIKNIKERYKHLNNISLDKISCYFQDTIILKYFNKIYTNNKNNNIYYYTYKAYWNSEDYNKRINNKKLFFKFYSLLNKLILQDIDENSFINFYSAILNFILLIWTGLTLSFETLSQYEKIRGQINELKLFLIELSFTYILMLVFIFFIYMFSKYKIKLLYIELNQEVEEILKKLNEEICILEKIINSENALKKIQINIGKSFLEDEDYIKKSLKIQENKIKIQKELYIKELEEIDEFYKNLELYLKN